MKIKISNYNLNNKRWKNTKRIKMNLRNILRQFKAKTLTLTKQCASKLSSMNYLLNWKNSRIELLTSEAKSSKLHMSSVKTLATPKKVFLIPSKHSTSSLISKPQIRTTSQDSFISAKRKDLVLVCLTSRTPMKAKALTIIEAQ